MQANPSPLPADTATTVIPPSLWRGILSDAAGNPSSMRAVLLAAVVAVFAAWVTVSVQTRTLQPLPDSVVTVVLGLTGAKLGQRLMEPKSGSIFTLSTQPESPRAPQAGSLAETPDTPAAPKAPGQIFPGPSAGPSTPEAAAQP